MDLTAGGGVLWFTLGTLGIYLLLSENQSCCFVFDGSVTTLFGLKTADRRRIGPCRPRPGLCAGGGCRGRALSF